MDIYLQIEQEIKIKNYIYLCLNMVINSFMFIYDTLLFRIMLYRFKNICKSEWVE